MNPSYLYVSAAFLTATETQKHKVTQSIFGIFREDSKIWGQNYEIELKQLNLPEYSFRIIEKDGTKMILDTIRRKYVKLTPEEWVRQNFVRYLVNEGKYPAGLIRIEAMFIFNKLKKRADILVHNRKGEPVLIVECKSPDIEIDENKIFEQITTYNMKYRVPYVVVTNGLYHYACKYDQEKNKYDYILVIPLYEDLLT